MAELITLREDCNLGPAGLQVWVDDPAEADTKPVKKTAAKRAAKKTAAAPDGTNEPEDNSEDSGDDDKSSD